LRRFAFCDEPGDFTLCDEEDWFFWQGFSWKQVAVALHVQSLLFLEEGWNVPRRVFMYLVEEAMHLHEHGAGLATSMDDLRTSLAGRHKWVWKKLKQASRFLCFNCQCDVESPLRRQAHGGQRPHFAEVYCKSCYKEICGSSDFVQDTSVGEEGDENGIVPCSSQFSWFTDRDEGPLRRGHPIASAFAHAERQRACFGSDFDINDVVLDGSLDVVCCVSDAEPELDDHLCQESGQAEVLMLGSMILSGSSMISVCCPPSDQLQTSVVEIAFGSLVFPFTTDYQVDEDESMYQSFGEILVFLLADGERQQTIPKFDAERLAASEVGEDCGDACFLGLEDKSQDGQEPSSDHWSPIVLTQLQVEAMSVLSFVQSDRTGRFGHCALDWLVNDVDTWLPMLREFAREACPSHGAQRVSRNKSVDGDSFDRLRDAELLATFKVGEACGYQIATPVSYSPCINQCASGASVIADSSDDVELELRDTVVQRVACVRSAC
jgi:hypothetical protein